MIEAIILTIITAPLLICLWEFNISPIVKKKPF